MRHSVTKLCEAIRGLSLSVSLSDWVRVLKDANAKDILLVGVAIPMKSEPSEIAAAVQLVRHAHEFLLRGENNAAVAECRRALESVWKARGLEQAARTARKSLSASQDERNDKAGSPTRPG